MEEIFKANSNTIAFVACIAAVISAVYAIYSKQVADRALKLAQMDFNNKQSSYDIYLIGGYRWKAQSEEIKIILLNITLNNKSDTKNSFQFHLQLEYSKDDKPAKHVLIDHNPDLIGNIENLNITAFSLPHKLEEKTSESKWLLFMEPVSTFRDYKINKYTLRVVDGRANVNQLDTYLLKSLTYDHQDIQ